MKRAAWVLSCVVLLCACERRVQVPPTEPSGQPGAPGGAAAANLPINIGDVEAQVIFACDVPEALDTAENITVDRKMTRRHDLGMLTIDIYPPYPTSLPVTLRVDKKLPINEDFLLILRGTLNKDEQPLHPFQLVMTRASDKRTLIAEVDVLAGVSSYPETTLVNAKVDAVLLPPNTDLATIDVATVQGTAQTQSILLSNPIRINFHPAKETP